MRFLLLLQTGIIITAAAYIYYLQIEPAASEPVREETLPVATTTVPDSITPPVVTPASTTATEALPVINGPHDQGMEWPTIEGELEVR